MKKKTVITVFLIVFFVFLSTFLVFKLPSDNSDNKKITIALVNEDNGVLMKDKYISYGKNFVESFQENSSYKYIITTRTKAENGLDDKTYDVALIILSDYSKNLLSYKEKKPKQAIIEYKTNNDIKQVEYLKNKLSTQEIKEQINKTITKSYNKEILHVFQDMQAKSKKIAKSQTDYNNNFKSSIETPMNDTYDAIDMIMSSSKTQQDNISVFGDSVETFSTNIIQRINEENTQKNTIDKLSEVNKQSTEMISNQDKSITDLINKLDTNKSEGNLKYLRDLINANQLSLSAIIDNLGKNNDSLSNLMTIVSKDKEAFVFKEYIYQEIIRLINTNGIDFTKDDIVVMPNLSESQKIDFAKYVDDIYASFMLSINSYSSKEIQTKVADNQIISTLATKEYIESKIIRMCQFFSEDNLRDETKLKEYCKSFTNLSSNDKYVDLKYQFDHSLELDVIEDKKLIIDFNNVSNGNEFKVTINNEALSLNNGIIEYDLLKDNKYKIDITVFSNQSVSNDVIKFTIGSEEELVNINQYYQVIEDNQLNNDLIELKSLIKFYYGKTIDTLTTSKMNKLASDLEEALVGIKAYRVYYTTDSLLYSVEQTEMDIKKDLGLAFAKEYTNIFNKQKNELSNYITKITSIYNINKTEIDNLKKQNTKTENLIKAFDDFYLEYEAMQSDLSKISDQQKAIITSNNDESELITTLSKNQITLIDGFKALQKAIESQQKQVDGIQKDAKKFSSDVAKMQKTTKEYQKKVNSIQSQFKNLTKQNNGYIEKFTKQYTNTKLKGKDNNEFYDNLVNPIDVKSDDNTYNLGSLIPFYLIIILAIFSLVNAYFINSLNVKEKEQSIFKDNSMYYKTNIKLLLLTLVSLLVGVIVIYIGIQALNFNLINIGLWITIILLISFVLSLVFYTLLSRLKSVGMLIIGLFMIIYLVSNSVLGISNNSLVFLNLLRYLNPLSLFEIPLQQVIQNIEVNILLLIVSSLSLIIISLVIIYSFRKKGDSDETSL